MSMPSGAPGPILSCFRLLGELRDQRIAGRADGDHGGDRHAALARRAVGGADQRVGGELEVGVGQHDRVVLRAAERLHALAVARAAVA